MYLISVATPYSTSIVSTSALAALALATVSPLSSRSLELAHIFRLNENLVAATSRYSTSIAAACAAVIVFAAHQAFHTSTCIPLASVIGMTALFMWLLSLYWAVEGLPSASSESEFYARTVKMVYKGPKATSTEDTQGGGTAASAMPRCPRSSLLLSRWRHDFIKIKHQCQYAVRRKAHMHCRSSSSRSSRAGSDHICRGIRV